MHTLFDASTLHTSSDRCLKPFLSDSVSVERMPKVTSTRRAAAWVAAIVAKLSAHADPKRAAGATRFFKADLPDHYGYGDRFLGVTNPELHAIVKTHRLDTELHHNPEATILSLLPSPYNERRMLALLFLVTVFDAALKRKDATRCEWCFRTYLSAVPKHVNNWNLVDGSAYYIVGPYLHQFSSKQDARQTLHGLAKSSNLWNRRVAVVSTLHWIRNGDTSHTFSLCKDLLGDPEDLMHKACGWMLREAGKREDAALRTFLQQHATAMPRTMLRYSIEKFPESERKAILAASKADRL